MDKPTLKFLDAQATTGIRLTTFGATIEDTVADFLRWIADNKVQPSELVYADLFERVNSGPTIIAKLALKDNGECEIVPATDEASSPLKDIKLSVIDKIRNSR